MCVYVAVLPPQETPLAPLVIGSHCNHNIHKAIMSSRIGATQLRIFLSQIHLSCDFAKRFVLTR